MKKIFFFLPAILFYALIFFMSSRSLRVEVGFQLFDKVIHILVFAVLALLLSFGFFKTLKSFLPIKVFLVLLGGVFLGILDEVHQSFVPQREFETMDILADGVGIVIGLGIYVLLYRKFEIFRET